MMHNKLTTAFVNLARPFRILIAVSAAGFFSFGCDAAELTITIDHLRNNQGVVLLCVFSAESSDTAVFPDCVKGRPARSSKAVITGGRVVMTFNGLKDGVYAVAMIHDENGNGELDTNIIGIPTEGLGVSNNPRLFGKPKFAEAQFTLTGKASITIETKYIL